MIPKIEFIYSKEYDDVFRELWYLSNTSWSKYVSDEISIQKYINEKIKPEWKIYEDMILTKIAEIWIYKRTETIIPIYIIWKATWLWSWTSKPMTIWVIKKPELIIDIITHELIHHYLDLWWKNIIDYYKLSNINYKSDNNTVIHIILYAMQYYIYKDIPKQWEYTLEILNKQNANYNWFINKAKEIWFEKIINDYQNFVEKNKQVLFNSKYPILRFPDANSYSLVFKKIINLKKNNNNLNISRNEIEEFKKIYFQKKYKLLSKIPKIISIITNIQWNHKFIYINIVSYNSYDINIPMTIGLYNNEDKIEQLTIKKIIKYFIYFHKKELQIYLDKNNFSEEEFEIYISQEIEKELSIFP